MKDKQEVLLECEIYKDLQYNLYFCNEQRLPVVQIWLFVPWYNKRPKTNSKYTLCGSNVGKALHVLLAHRNMYILRVVLY